MPADLALAGRRIFPGSPAAVRDARRFVAGLLGDAWPGLDEVLLLVSEVASNAIRHTASGCGGAFAVAVSVTGPTVRVEVEDDGGSSEPVIPAGDGLDGMLTGGRGLRIVDALAAKWGHGGDELGRAVWFEISTRPAGH